MAIQEQLSITKESSRELERACRWLVPPSFLERSPAPFTSRLYQTTWGRVWTFPDARSAQAWNDDWEAWLRRSGAALDRLLDAADAEPISPIRRWIERHACAALLEEMAGGAPAPVALAGGRCSLTMTLVYHVSSLAWLRDELTLQVQAAPWGPFGDDAPFWTLVAERTVPLESLPPGAAELLARSRWPWVETAYPPRRAC